MRHDPLYPSIRKPMRGSWNPPNRPNRALPDKETRPFKPHIISLAPFASSMSLLFTVALLPSICFDSHTPKYLEQLSVQTRSDNWEAAFVSLLATTTTTTVQVQYGTVYHQSSTWLSLSDSAISLLPLCSIELLGWVGLEQLWPNCNCPV